MFTEERTSDCRLKRMPVEPQRGFDSFLCRHTKTFMENASELGHRADSLGYRYTGNRFTARKLPSANNPALSVIIFRQNSRPRRAGKSPDPAFRGDAVVGVG